MNVLILAAGFGIRLYPLTKDTPKALIKVNNRPIIEYQLEKIKQIEDIEKIYILSNNKFFINFLEWLDNFKKLDDLGKKIRILNNGVNNDEEKNGAVKDIKYSFDIIEDKELFLMASDNLFSFDLNLLKNLSLSKNSTAVALKIVEDLEAIKKYSCVVLDNNNKIIDFEEKPVNPKTNISCTACYLLNKESIERIKDHDFTKKDNFGEIISFLSKVTDVHGVIYDDPWYDIGSLETLEKINKELKKRDILNKKPL